MKIFYHPIFSTFKILIYAALPLVGGMSVQAQQTGVALGIESNFLRFADGSFVADSDFIGSDSFGEPYKVEIFAGFISGEADFSFIRNLLDDIRNRLQSTDFSVYSQALEDLELVIQSLSGGEPFSLSLLFEEGIALNLSLSDSVGPQVGDLPVLFAFRAGSNPLSFPAEIAIFASDSPFEPLLSSPNPEPNVYTFTNASGKLYNQILFGDPGSLQLVSTAFIPEPSTISLFIAGLSFVVVLTLRRRSQKA